MSLSSMQKAGLVGMALAVGSAFASGYMFGAVGSPSDHAAHGQPAPALGAKAEVWTCAMHAHIRLPGPGPCPVCGMDLILDTSGKDDSGPRELSMSESDRKLAEIVTRPVERRMVTAPIRMVGKIHYDETRVRTVSARIPGRLDRLFVDFTGVSVREGDHLVSIYSPALLAAQEELLQAKERVAASGTESSEFLRKSDLRALESAREKLRLWGIEETQIREIEARGKAEDHVVIRSPMGGVVIKKHLQEGAYVSEGTPIYMVADLSRLWVKLDAYESDLPWVRYGQEVEIATEAYPGNVFTGWISFIDPILDARTRTVKVRVNVANPDGRLKPGMFVRAVVRARVAGGGRVMDPRLSGKWVSPMHPEIVKDEAGSCDVCGMALVRAEDLGYVTPGTEAAKPLVVPVSAVLRTGKRAVLYVEVPDAERPTYEGREVVLGPRAGEWYIVRSGVAVGERVVVNGAFKIDSALQIQAKPAMMSMPAEVGPEPAGASELRTALEPVYAAYLAIWQALAGDELAQAGAAFGRLADAVGGVDMRLLSGDAHGRFMELSSQLTSVSTQGAAAADLESARRAFANASAQVTRLEHDFGHAGDAVHVEVFCPMAFGCEGASWLQSSDEVTNPFFGASMLRCGSVKGRHPARGGSR